MRRSSHSSPGIRDSAFTLVELLVVIGIIGLLIGLLLPAVSKIRAEAQRTATLNTINRIAAACEQYFADFTSYPGAIAQNQVYNSVSGTAAPQIAFTSGHYPGSTTPAATTNVTATESMVMALLGGLRNTGTNAAPVYEFDLASIGQGVAGMNTLKPSRHTPFLEAQSNELSPSNPTSPAGVFLNDSSLPEIMDNFGSPHPIVYMRAFRGASGFLYNSAGAVMSGDIDPQYDVRELYAYGFPMADNAAYLAANPADSTSGLPPGDGAYFGNHELSRTAGGTSVFVPQHKDGFILISAGRDGIFGTADDVRN